MSKRKPNAQSAPASDSWYALASPDSADEAELMIYDAIGAYGITADEFVRDVKAITAKTINVRLNTPGGSVFDGTAIHNALREHPARIVTHVDGVAASAGSFIAMAGDEVRMADNAYMMVHNAWGGVMGDSDDMRRQADLVDKMSANIAGMYAAKTGKPVAYWHEKMDAETWFTAEDAKAEGLIDVVSTPAEKPKQTTRAEFSYGIFNKIPDAVRAMWGINPNQPSSKVPPRGEPGAQPQEKKPVTLESFNTYAAEHPDAVAGFIEQGYTQAKADLKPKAASVADLRAAFAGEDAFVLAQLEANATMGQANAEAVKMYRDRLAAVDAKHAEALAAKDQQIAQLQIQVGEVGPVNTTAATAAASTATDTNPAAPVDPKAAFEAEWEANAENCQNTFVSKDVYVRARLRTA